MDYKDEQSQELEVLESIYPDEFAVQSDEYPKVQFSVSLPLDLVPLESSSFTQDSINMEHHLVLNFKLPETYPETVPEITIECEQERKANVHDDSEDSEEDEEVEYDEHGNPVESKLANLPDQVQFDEYVKVLESQVESQASEDMLIGMQMCFALVSWIKESCEHHFQERLAELEREHERKLLDREAEEQKKFRGTKVTSESYLEWRAKFREETGLNERDAARKVEAHSGRLTGRQIFEQGLDGSEDVEEE
ncbi:Gir2p [Lachancea thermotolerans CBS 6340]|uniref:KLTH0G11924p n=1 Tax=Lachancea thermotolerans (strain ATCC 56472 / CBS 6340 / NRRL Y-8284) TaxID=559295 RepID=C5DMV4_LACTC|nr:KLTH0G11924p [Lachancea thermotolerans CBS 6340]CAR25115.1 KLTH0G11924p [Lachancea thermotolerans CBS 6340]